MGEASVDDLRSLPHQQKAEIVGGRLVLMTPSGHAHGRAGLQIILSLSAHVERTGRGSVLPDNVGFIVDLPNRRSFSPDVAYHVGAFFGEDFIQGAPAFAVEVRSTVDDGPAAERAMAEKRADYFAAGTLVVWDVAPRQRLVRVFRAASPDEPTVYGAGDVAEAEPAVPGWTFEVSRLWPAEA
jgi:Uma2 family endonuclease